MSDGPWDRDAGKGEEDREWVEKWYERSARLVLTDFGTTFDMSFRSM